LRINTDEIMNKLIENIMKISKVCGFYITIPGDMSVGIDDQEFKVEGDFYFDNEKELSEFKYQLMLTFSDYCGENPLVETFEERQLQIDIELERI
jgi:hypothetical protein